MGNCIELDTSFSAIKLYMFSVPTLIHRNTEISLALLVGPVECHELYLLLYNSFNLINSELYDILLSTKILSDEHSSFECLQKRYVFALYYCYVHLIRSFEGHSSIPIQVHEVLFCKSEEEFFTNLPRFIKTFKLFREIEGFPKTCRKKFISILGFNENGEQVDRNPHMEPLFLRMAERVPTSTNHAERFHRYVNETVGNYKNQYNKINIFWFAFLRSSE